jgi:predicted O-methyltransferase YrrM
LQIVEIGTAFGVSGMYWLSGLEEAGEGRLLTFEPNAVWQSIAKRNLSIISDRAASVASTFEDAIASGQIPERSLDILFIDGIHTASAVRAQIDAALRLLKEGAIIVLDDIQFSPGFYGYWKDLANDSRVKASFEVEGRLGLIEF